MEQFKLVFECEECKGKISVSRAEAPNSLTHKKEFNVNGKSIFLTYYDCPSCGRRHYVQIDDKTSLGELKKVTVIGEIVDGDETSYIDVELSLPADWEYIPSGDGRIDYYMDEAMRSNASSVRIIHGKGTGALRAAVQQSLKKNKYVKKFRLGVYGEGEDGVTIAEFR